MGEYEELARGILMNKPVKTPLGSLLEYLGWPQERLVNVMSNPLGGTMKGQQMGMYSPKPPGEVEWQNRIQGALGGLIAGGVPYEVSPQDMALNMVGQIRGLQGIKFTGKVFHGGNITESTPFKGLGVHASEDLATAKIMSESGKIQSFNLTNANLLKIRDFGGRHDNALFTVRELVKDGVLPQEWLKGLPERLIGDQAGWGTRNLQELARVKDYLKSKGYDGLIYENIVEKSAKPSVVMFENPFSHQGIK